MKTAKLSLINIAIIATVCLAGVFVWSVSRNAAFKTTSVTFESASELIVTPVAEKTIVRPIASSAKAVALPALNVIPAPLPIVSPKILTRVIPQYPSIAVDNGIEGTVVLGILVSESGRPDKVEVRTSSGSLDLDRSASDAAKAWTFEPARRGVEAVSSWFEVPVRFKIR